MLLQFCQQWAKRAAATVYSHTQSLTSYFVNVYFDCARYLCVIFNKVLFLQNKCFRLWCICFNFFIVKDFALEKCNMLCLLIPNQMTQKCHNGSSIIYLAKFDQPLTIPTLWGTLAFFDMHHKQFFSCKFSNHVSYTPVGWVLKEHFEEHSKSMIVMMP